MKQCTTTTTATTTTTTTTTATTTTTTTTTTAHFCISCLVALLPLASPQCCFSVLLLPTVSCSTFVVVASVASAINILQRFGALRAPNLISIYKYSLVVFVASAINILQRFGALYGFWTTATKYWLIRNI